jgi:hypothetical protein
VYHLHVSLIHASVMRTHSAKIQSNVCTHATGRVTRCTVNICTLICRTTNIVTLTTLKGLCLVYHLHVSLIHASVMRTHSAKIQSTVCTHATGRVTHCTVNHKRYKYIDFNHTQRSVSGVSLVCQADILIG